MQGSVMPFVPPPLAESVLDRAGHHRTDAAWLAAAFPPARVLRVSASSRAPVTTDGRLDLVSGSDLPDLLRVEPADGGPLRIFLGEYAGAAYFAVQSDEEAKDRPWVGLRDLGALADRLDLDLLVTAVALVQWHLRHTHCPRCGAPTEVRQAGWTRVCSRDSSQHFPRTDPAVIMVVHDGPDRCLLGRGTQWAAGRYSTLAGFVEPGESLEEAVAREVFEETAVRVSEVTYVASQPWPFPASLMLGFFARADSSLSLQVDGVEMMEAAWFTREQVRRAAEWVDTASALPPGGLPVGADPGAQLQAISPPLSISRYLIDQWLAGRVTS
ncbi:MAG: NAD(+) diphosphatase [Actinobacteria bacterium]|nr:NAD(+) diphosphatase [Actinomycetota bacterium]